MNVANPRRRHDPRHFGAVLLVLFTPSHVMKAGPGCSKDAGRNDTAAITLTPVDTSHNAFLLSESLGDCFL